MPTKALLITLNLDQMRRRAARKRTVDIGRLISRIPTINVISGNPKMSLCVQVDEKHEGELRSAVESKCTVSSYKEFMTSAAVERR